MEKGKNLYPLNSVIPPQPTPPQTLQKTKSSQAEHLRPQSCMRPLPKKALRGPFKVHIHNLFQFCIQTTERISPSPFEMSVETVPTEWGLILAQLWLGHSITPCNAALPTKSEMAARGRQKVFGHSKQLSLNKFFDPSTPSVRKGHDRGKKKGEKNRKKKKRKD